MHASLDTERMRIASCSSLWISWTLHPACVIRAEVFIGCKALVNLTLCDLVSPTIAAECGAANWDLSHLRVTLSLGSPITRRAGSELLYHTLLRDSCLGGRPCSLAFLSVGGRCLGYLGKLQGAIQLLSRGGMQWSHFGAVGLIHSSKALLESPCFQPVS